MADLGIILAIFSALAIGFGLGRLSSKAKVENAKLSLPWSPKRYFEGLTYLLNEQTDETIDQFISSMDVNSETLEVHLSLGGLLRRKGEFARAVKVHQNLLAQTILTTQQLQLVQLELAKDYIHSGLLDRAENLLTELVEQKQIEKKLRVEGLECLIDIYQDTHEWLKAIDVADRLTTSKFASHTDYWRRIQAQYCCELANAARNNDAWQDVRRWIKTALRYDKDCVRASLLQADLDIADEKYPAAIAALKMIPRQNPELASEMLMPMVECYRKLESFDELKKELESYLETYSDKRALHILYLLLQERGEDISSVVAMLIRFLPRFPHMSAALELVQALNQEGGARTVSFRVLKSTFDNLLLPEAYYECAKCGFTGQNMHWLCPSCKSWEAQHLLA